MRSCIGCRSVKDKNVLLRYVLSPENELVLDYNSKLPGRGCYVCADVTCLDKAIKQRAFQRSFKSKIVVVDKTEDFIKVILKRSYGKIASYLSFAVRGKKVALGTLAVELDLKKGRIALLLISSDMSASAVDKWKGRLKNNINCKVVEKFEGFEPIIGNRKVVGIRDEGLALEIAREIEIIEKLDFNIL
ncbi:MAG: DUF448 domain-containing protein [Proteobacteria bacterium]|nr:DUF448 domain-containing protein [Pseudomonadota bacterium]